MTTGIRTLISLALLGGLAGPAAAQSPSPTPPSEAETLLLEQQARAWISGVLGGQPVAMGAVTFKPDGAGYLISLPVGTAAQITPKGAAITIRAHRLDGTRWAIDDQRVPPELGITLQQSVPNATDDTPDATGTHTDTVQYAFKFGKQAATGIFDPTYATPTNSQGSIDTIDMVQTGGPLASISHFGGVATNTSITSSAPGHLDLVTDTLMQTYETRRELAGRSGTVDAGLTITMEKLHLVTAVSGFAVDRWSPVAAAVAMAMNAQQVADSPPAEKAVPDRPTPGKPVPGAQNPTHPVPGQPLQGGASPPGKPESAASAPATADAAKALRNAQVRAILIAAHDLLTGGRFEQTAERVKFDASGHAGAIAHLGISLAGDAPQDMLKGSMALTVDGMVIDELPPAIASYVPGHFTIHPVISNLDVAALTKAAMDGTAPGSDGPPDTDLEALFAKGGINFGFDALGLDIGETKFTGTGSFNAAGPQTVTGQAEISATNLDALISKAQADPTVQQALPFAIFLKGIAKTNEGRSTWLVTLTNGRALVNGVDLSSLGGGR